MRILIICLSLLLSGCATRYLTEAEDAKMREICENKESGGCAVIQGNVWEFVQKLLGGTGI